jgi:hypothetical protein
MDPKIARALQGADGVAGVRWLLTDAEPQVVLHDALTAALPDPALLQGRRLYRAKYKPGRHLTAYYEIMVGDPQTGATHSRHVEAIWLPGAADPRGAPESALRVEQEARQRGLVAPFLRLSAEAPAQGLWLRISPLDPEFPQIARLSDPEYAGAILALLQAPQAGGAADGYAVSVVRYRPGQRHVLRYDPAGAGGAAGEGSLFAKVYNSDKGRRTFAVVRTIADWLAAQGGSIGTVRPLAYLSEEQTVLYPWVVGTPLSQLLPAPGYDAPAQLAHAGAALRALHGIPLDLVELQPHSLAKEIKSTASAAEHIHTLLPETGARIRAILGRAEALHEHLPQEQPGFAYGDYKSDHLWVTPAGLTLIDFDTCYQFDPAIDVGKFLADLRWWHDCYGLGDVEGLQSCFLEGYMAAPERLARARLYEVLVLVKTSARRIKLFDPSWAERTAGLIALADRLLGALESSAGRRAS